MDALREKNRRLVAAVTMMDGAYYRWARSTGVTGQTLDLLYALDDGQPHSQKQICEEWLIPKTTVSTVVKACQAAGYLTLEAMPGQGRQRRLCLTPAGRAYAGRTLGLSDRYVFWHIRMPVCRQGILAGTVLSFARALGEYGATSMIAGYTPGRTATISTTVYQLWRTGQDALALRWVLVNLALSASVLAAVNLLERKEAGRWR